MEDNYNIVMVFAIHQHELATGIYVSPPILNPSPTSLHPIPLGCPRAQALGVLFHASLALVICFTYGNARVSMLFSQITPPSPSPIESKSLFLHLCLLCFLVCRIIGPVFYWSDPWCKDTYSLPQKGTGRLDLVLCVYLLTSVSTFESICVSSFERQHKNYNYLPMATLLSVKMLFYGKQSVWRHLKHTHWWHRTAKRPYYKKSLWSLDITSETTAKIHNMNLLFLLTSITFLRCASFITWCIFLFYWLKIL